MAGTARTPHPGTGPSPGHRSVPEQIEARLLDHFGQIPDRASVSFVGASTLEVVRFRSAPGLLTMVTVGMSAEPMTERQQSVRAADGPRAELVLEIAEDPRFGDVWRQLAVLAAAPQVEGVVYMPGMTIDLTTPLADVSRCTGVVVTACELPIPDGLSEVSLLSVVPATANELAFARARGSDELLLRWAAAGTSLVDLARASVALG